MKYFPYRCFFILICFYSGKTCQIDFNSSDELRLVEERKLFSLIGEIRFCPKFLFVENISTSNFDLKRLKIVDFNYFIETNQLNLTILPRLVGFAQVSIEFYFRKISEKKFRVRIESTESGTIDEKICENCENLKIVNDSFLLSKTIRIGVKRRQTIIDRLFTIVVLLLVAFGTLCVGSSLEISLIVQVVKRPFPLIVGLFSQIVYVPILSYGLTKILRFDKSNSLGLISTASSPAGASSNLYTAVLGGDVDLSITMTFFSTSLAFGTFPFWIWALNEEKLDSVRVVYPWLNMILSFSTLFLPTVIGLCLRHFRPVLAHRISLFLHPIVLGYLVFILTFGVYINRYLLKLIDLKLIIGCCSLPWLGFLGGALFSSIFVRDRRKIISICIETGIHNTASSIVFLRFILDQPQSDLALANPILVSLSIPIPFLLIFIVKSLFRTNSRENSMENKIERKQNSI